MTEPKTLTKQIYLSRIYVKELEYINRIMLFQEYHYKNCGELVILLDSDFPNFKILSDKKVAEIIFLYECSGWKIRLEKLKDRTECLLIFS